MSVIINPIEQYFNLDGSPLTNGYLYFGVPFGNPVTEPTTVYFDPEFTIPAAQPVRTVNGYPVRSGTATGLFAPDDVSILVQNSAKEQVIYIESSSVSSVQTNTFYRDSNTLLTADDNNKIFIATLPFTQTIDASVALGSAWSIQYVNMSNGLIIFDPNLSETIDGQTTVSLQPNHSIFIRCDGVNLTSTSSPYPVQSVSSAPALDLTVTKSKLINITGVASITSVSMVNGDVIKAIASSAFQLVNSSSLIVQGAANYTATVNDIFTFSKDSAGNTHVEIQKINGQAVTSISFATDAEYIAGTDTTKALNSAVARTNSIVEFTPVTLTTQTSVDFTGIPSWAKEITIQFENFSTNGTSIPIVQIGDSGGIETTNYLGTVFTWTGGNQSSNHSSGFGLVTSGIHAATSVIHGSVVLRHVSGNDWACTILLSNSNNIYSMFGSGTKSLSATLDRIRVTAANGTDQMDGGILSANYR